uniref:MACPF domain-containing protein n=1 Tax=Physcomitrium patens TaxID=3218 RepID=A0A7I4D0I6_PHYPA
MEARRYELDTHSMSAPGVYAAYKSGRDSSRGSGRIEEHVDPEPAAYPRRQRATRGGFESPAKRANGPTQQADSLKTIYPGSDDTAVQSKSEMFSQPTPQSDSTPVPARSTPSKRSQYAWKVAVDAANALGRGFDVTSDIRLGFAKGSSGSRLVEIDETNTQDIVAPGNVVIPNVSVDISCHKGEKTHYASEVLPFAQMCSRFNQAAAIDGKMPLGLFNSMFNFNGPWQADQNATKALAMDGWFVKLYSLQLTRSPLTLRDEIRKAIPSSWEPKALASFIEKYGTHVIISLQVGGKDVIYVKQHQNSPTSSTDVQKLMESTAEKRFTGQSNGHNTQRERLGKDKVMDSFSPISTAARLNIPTPSTSQSKEGVEIIFRRRGGDNMVDSHQGWLATVSETPDVIAMTFVPISSLISGIPGNGYLSHAVNLYMRYKPPIEELQNFLEFQLPTQWSPSLAELALGPRRKEPVCPAMQFSLMGPKLYVSTNQVSVGRRPVTGLRLFLEGVKCNRLAIHLQHLTTLPRILQPHWDTHVSIGKPIWKAPEEQDTRWFEPVQWKGFSHVSTAPIEFNESWVGEANDAHIVTGAQLQVWDFGIKNVLFLRLLFSRVPKCSIRRSVWDNTPAISQKSGLFSQLGFSGKQQTQQQQIPV